MNASRCAVVAILLAACASNDRIDRADRAVGPVKSQLRGYDLGPPFPAGLRDSGLVNGYAEGEWIPFVAVVDGKKLDDADAADGGSNDGTCLVTLILPTYSDRNAANGLSDLQVVGTYGQGSITPIPTPFDDRWLIDHAMSPFELGAWPDVGDADRAPQITAITQRVGPTRFGGDVASVAVTVYFAVEAAATHVDLRFAVRLAPPDLAPIRPGDQAFPGALSGTAAGAGGFFPGPGPLFVGYQVGDPTGIATVPIRVDRHHCDSEEDCLPGELCGEGGDCEPPCVSDAECPADEICEDGVCEPPPPPCEDDGDCGGEDVCSGGYCVPPCPDECADPEFCDPDPCVPPGGGEPPCVTDAQCPGDEVCEDGLCQPLEPPCDVSCPEGEVCHDGVCSPPDHPCTDDSDCSGGEVCAGDVCQPGEPPCNGDCPSCTYPGDCEGGDTCVDGQCVGLEPPVPCADDAACPSGQTCEGGFCTPPEPCGPSGTCPVGELCEPGGNDCIDEHPPIPCTAVGDCPSGDQCVGGWCTPPDGGGPGAPCKNWHDCDDGLECIDKVCTPPDAPPCFADWQCDPGEQCLGGDCVPPHPPIPCSAASDCPSGDECLGGWCQPPQGCTNDHQCPGGELCEDGTCRPGQPPVPCTVSSDCPPGTDDVWPEVCYGGFCTPGGPSCTDDADCPGGQVCGPDVCVDADPPQPCRSSYDCGGGAACEGGYCVPTDPTDQCTVPEDCPPNANDDVGPACVNGVCTSSRVLGPACASTADCPVGATCLGGACSPVAGACNLDGDCGDGDTCIDGWCGQACTGSDDCAAGSSCMIGRCGGSCRTYSDCGSFEACLGGTCLPVHAILSTGRGGDSDPWQVDVPGESGSGCSAGGSGGSPLLLLLALAGAAVRRRSRVRAASLAALALLVFPAGCGDGGTAGPPDAEPAPDAGSSGGDPSGDGGVSSPFWLVTCEGGADPTADAGASADAGDLADAGPVADAGPAADAGPPAGLDQACCAPEGACPGDLACIEGPSPDQHRCRPRCDLAVGDCPDGGVCADFDGEGVCIPASTLGQACAPELCDAETICVGSSADDAVCRLRCTSNDDCRDGEACLALQQTSVNACLPGY